MASAEHMRTRLIWIVVGFAAVVAFVGAAVLGRVQDEELGRIRTAVEKVLTSEPPRGYAPIPQGVRLISIARDDKAIVLDFSRELLAEGHGRVLEDALHQILTAASSARAPVPDPTDDYTVLVDGVPLENHLR